MLVNIRFGLGSVVLFVVTAILYFFWRTRKGIPHRAYKGGRNVIGYLAYGNGGTFLRIEDQKEGRFLQVVDASQPGDSKPQYLVTAPIRPWSQRLVDEIANA